MEQDRNPQRSQLFTVRLWKEELSSGQVEVRCKVQHVLSGETRSFRDFVQVRAFLLDKLQQFDGELGQGPNE